MGNGGVIISDSTVYAYTVSEDGYGAIASDNDVSISNSTVDARTNSIYGDVTIWAGDNLTSTPGNITISDNSKVTIYSATGNAAYTPTGNIVISDSEVKATASGDYPALIAAYDVTDIKRHRQCLHGRTRVWHMGKARPGDRGSF